MGHRISESGIETVDSKIKVIHEWPTPKTVIKVRNFSAQVIQTLDCLILEENTSKKKKVIVWDGDCKDTFRKLKEICTSNPIIAYVNFLKPFQLHTEVYTLALGAILFQIRIGLITLWAMQVGPSARLSYHIGLTN